MKFATGISALVMAAGLSACSPEEDVAPIAPETSATPAEAAGTIAESENVKPFMVGNIEAAALKDGGAGVPNDAKTFAINKSPEEVASLLSAAGAPTDAIAISIQPMLLKTGDGVMLFDTGLGAANGGSLMTSLSSAGVSPEDITDIFISHSHYDHVGGLANADGVLGFPNATIHMSKNEWAAMQANAQQAALVAAITPKVAAFEAGAELAPGTVTAVDIQGHTPGHSGYKIISGDESLLYIGDTMHSSVMSVQRPDWTIAFDGDAPLAQASRKEVLAASADSNQRVYAVHFPFPGLGAFERNEAEFVWQPE